MTEDRQGDGKPALVGLLTLAGGLGLNYLFERHNVFKIWENSPYPISWADGFYPPVCVFLSLAGVVLAIGGATSHISIRRLLLRALAIALPLTILHTLFT